MYFLYSLHHQLFEVMFKQFWTLSVLVSTEIINSFLAVDLLNCIVVLFFILIFFCVRLGVLLNKCSLNLKSTHMCDPLNYSLCMESFFLK